MGIDNTNWNVVDGSIPLPFLESLHDSPKTCELVRKLMHDRRLSSQTIFTVDGPLIITLKFFGDITAKLLVKFFTVVALTPTFFLPGVAVAAAGMLCGQIYIKAQRSIKREMSNARAPVVGQSVAIN